MARDDSVERTLSRDADSLDSPHGQPPGQLRLTILWSRDEPDRVGEHFVVPAGRGPMTLGRAHDAMGPGWLIPRRQGHSGAQTQPPLQAPGISREQLTLRREPGGILVENVGRATLRVNGSPTPRASVLPGDLLELHRELLLLVTEAPAQGPSGLPTHDFGGPDVHGLVGESPAMWRLRAQIQFLGATEGHALIRGPSGAGKELVAAAVHGLSPDAGGMVSRNAATLPPGLVDAELFGNAKGFPNPGMPGRLGSIGEADGGTLFLDEIGELSHELQAHLLRVLDAGEYQRLGEDRRRTSRFRLLAATNRPVESLKHDFAARLHRRVEVPGLNERREDIPLLARHLLRRMAARNPDLFPSGPPRLHPQLVGALVLRDWTTHVRELQALLWKAVEGWTLSGGGKYLNLELERPAPRRVAVADPSALTREEIIAAYAACDGVQARVVTYLGLKSRFQLARVEKRLGVTPTDRSPGADA